MSTQAATPSAQQTPFPVLEVFPNQYPHRNYVITIDIPEFTSVCPMTGLPDFGTITIDYVADEVCLELKALKYYMLAYRNHGVFYEHVVNKILDDMQAACKPRYMEITGKFTPRGGIRSTITATYRKEGFEFDR
jgi:7-cyano-7-deazaguanine reductase